MSEIFFSVWWTRIPPNGDEQNGMCVFVRRGEETRRHLDSKMGVKQLAVQKPPFRSISNVLMKTRLPSVSSSLLNTLVTMFNHQVFRLHFQISIGFREVVKNKMDKNNSSIN